MLPAGANIRLVEMSMNDAWFRDIGPTVSFSPLLQFFIIPQFKFSMHEAFAGKIDAHSLN